MNGQDVQGGEAGILYGYGEPGHRVGAFGNAGRKSGLWDTFLSVSARQGELDDSTTNIARFWGDLDSAVPPEDRYGDDQPGDAYFTEASGRIAYNDQIFISGRIADNHHPYALTDSEGTYTWREAKDVFSGFVKLESKLDLDFNSGLRWMASYSWLDPEYEIIDRTLRQDEDTIYTELIVDRSFRARRSLFTGGVSFREQRVDGAPVGTGICPTI